MKKNELIIAFIVLLCILTIHKVEATVGLDITTNSNIKYKWYTEEKVDGTYYAKGEKLEGYYEDASNIKYGPESSLDTKYCQYSRDKYVVYMDVERIYKHVIDAHYVKIIGISEDTNIRIFANTNEINYTINKKENNEIIIDLKRNYEVGILWFYIETNNPFDIYLSFDERFTMLSLYKYVENQKIIIPDETWIFQKTTEATTYTHENKSDNAFLKYAGQRARCRVREIQTYRYKIKRNYYDDQYHEYIQDYIRDYENYLIEYNGELPTNTVNITKTIKEIVPIKEYIYVDVPKEEQEIITTDKNNTLENNDEIESKTEIKYIENDVIKKINVIPPKIYYLIIFLTLIIVIQFIIIIKKKVD